MIYKILTVAGLATFEIYAAIPAGFAFGLSPWVIFLASLSGGVTGVFVAAFLGEKIEALIAKFRKPKVKTSDEEKVKKPNLAHKLWDKYGIVGLGVLGTFLVGAPVSIAVGVGFNVNMHKLATWCCVGVLIRCIVFTTIGYFGMKLF